MELAGMITVVFGVVGCIVLVLLILRALLEVFPHAS